MALSTPCSFILISLYLLSTIPKSISLPTYLYNICPNTKFPPTSKYKTNLNTLLRSLSSNATANPTGFYITSVGNGTKDAVYGLFLCRGDLNATVCSDCVTTAANTDLPKTYCPSSNVATIWYDECMVRYSNESLFGRMVVSPRVYLIHTRYRKGSRFVEDPKDTLYSMEEEAANNDVDGKKFAAKTVKYLNSSVALYALAQCTPDLTTKDCKQCLGIAITHLPSNSAPGQRMLLPSCNARLEIYPFFNVAGTNTDQSLPSSAPSLHPRSSTNGPLPIRCSDRDDCWTWY